jgi:hypothetical protein
MSVFGFPTASSTSFVATVSVSCVQNQFCGVTCSNGRIYIQNGFLLNGDYQRVFTASLGVYDYGVIVPICGIKPTSPNFNSGDIFQSQGSTVYSLGTMTTGLRMGTFDGRSALSASYTGGTSASGCPSGGARTSEVVLVCDQRYTSQTPLVAESEVECRCEFFISLFRFVFIAVNFRSDSD